MYQKDSLLDMLGRAHWYQKAIIHMIIDYMDNFLPDKHLQLSENNITVLDEIFISIRKSERSNLLNLTSMLFMLHQVMLRLSLNPNPSSIPDIVVISAIIGSKLGFDDDVYNTDFIPDFYYKSKYHSIKTLHLLEADHLTICNFQVGFPLDTTQCVSRVAELLKYVPQKDLQDLIDTTLPHYHDQNLLKLAQALLDVSKIDITKAAPNRHRQAHPSLFTNRPSIKPEKKEIKMHDDDINVNYANKIKK